MEAKDISGVGDLSTVLPSIGHTGRTKNGTVEEIVTRESSEEVVVPVVGTRGTEGVPGHGKKHEQ